MLTHDRALDLAAMAIDFRLSAADNIALAEHLGACSACRSDAGALRRDAERLMALPPVPPPAWVALAIGKRGRPVGLTLATAALVLSGVLAAAAVAGSVLLDVPQPSPSPFDSLSPTAVSRPVPRPYPSTWLNTALRVTAPELVLRQVPAVAGAEIWTARRDFVLVTDGSLHVEADGYDWYHAAILAEVPLLQPLPAGLRDARGASGWIAVRSAQETLALPMDARCPLGVALDDVAGMLEAERLACFGGGRIEVEGVFTCPSCGSIVEGVYAPVWLAGRSFAELRPDTSDRTGLVLHLPPDGPEWPAEGSRVRVRGHLDDPVATTCGLSSPTPDFGDPESTFSPVDIESVRLLCRQAFVVDSFDLVSSTGSTGS